MPPKPEKNISATRSMGTRLGKLKSAVTDLEEVLNELKVKPSILEVEASHIQKLEQVVTKRFDSIDDKWEELEDEGDFADEHERGKCQSDFNEAKTIHKSALNASRQVLSQPREATPNANQSTTTTATPSGPSKIVDTLKPRCTLNEEMTLEEAQLWFKNYKAHLAYNKDALAKQEIQVQRAMLDVDLDPRMASALRSHEKIKDETKIDATDQEVSCLETLREIFLEKNPLWLRRHWYFQCVQK